jgi:dTDP-4-amino-4,6-dideoxygalactose transaminase
MPKNISLFEIYSDEDDIKAVSDVIRRGKYWADGPEIKQFEEAISVYVGRKYALTFNSGTSALHSALLAHAVGAGDEVIVPSFTFISTANTVLLAGAKPIFAEIEDNSYGLSTADVARRITRKTKAIIPVHYGGAPCQEIEALAELASDHNLLLIEDAAEGFGSKLGVRNVGAFGDSAMFSFCQNKVVATGEGGAIVTDSEEVYQKLRLIRSHGRLEKEAGYFSSYKPMEYIQIGYNYRMPTVCAALGLSQLKKIDYLIKKRQGIATSLNNKLARIPGVKVPTPPKDVHHIYQMYTVEVPPEQRDGLQEHLIKRGVMTKIYFTPIHLEPFYKEIYGSKQGDLPVTEAISKSVLTLPMHPKLTLEDIDYMVEQITEYFG